jgi:hypothetical protein
MARRRMDQFHAQLVALLCNVLFCRCEPASGSPRDDAALLPWREQLEGALHAAFGLLRSPTEHESNKLITSECSVVRVGCAGMLTWQSNMP